MKLLLVYTGGTIGMVQSPEGDLSPFNFDEVLRQVPELNQLECDIETIQAWEPLDSSDINHNHWIKLADILNNNRDQYDGFVILHGTDTMAYTASALSFMLNNFSKPIILTGSQLPIGVLRSDGRENLITSIELAMARKNDETAIIKEVAVYFENKLFRGNRVYKRSSQAFEAFSSPNYPVLANVGVHIDINKQHTLAPVESYFCKNNLDPSVGILTLFPGIDEEISRALVLESKRNAIILHTYGSGNVPKLNWLPSLLDEAHEKGVLHRAFSIFLFNPEGETLIQQRAGSKYHSPLLWTNTCCSHPRVGETIQEAAQRRLTEELCLPKGIKLNESFSFIPTYSKICHFGGSSFAFSAKALGDKGLLGLTAPLFLGYASV